MRAPAVHPAEFLAGKADAEHVLAHQVLRRWRAVGLGLDLAAKVAQHLHRALVGDMRARRVGQPAVAVHDHVLDAVARQQRRRRRPGGAGADDQDVGLDDVSHLLCSFNDQAALDGEKASRCGRRSDPTSPAGRKA